MTREEAREILTHNWTRVDNPNYSESELDEAFFMAIEALTDRPSGEWKYLHGSIGSYMTIHCPFCGNTFNDVAEWEYNYCPSCGARMKGGDDE